MNKTELVAALAEKTQLPKKNAELALNAVVEVITESLSKGDKVQIVGFGSFEVKDRPERIARNPQKPRFVGGSMGPTSHTLSGKSLKDAVNQ